MTTRYCPYYCEENIWHLCADPQVTSVPSERRVLFVANRDRRVAMWGQRLSTDPELPVVWDYHVVLLVRQFAQPGWGQPGWELWDLDAAIPPPRPALTWLDDCFRGAGVVPPQFEPQFRVVPASAFRRHFRSDRSHMRAPDGGWLQPPPDWPAILGEPFEGDGEGSNLDRFLDVEDPAFLGEVFDLRGLRRWLG